RHQPRRDNDALDPAFDEAAVQTETGRASLVAAGHARPPAQRPHHRAVLVTATSAPQPIRHRAPPPNAPTQRARPTPPSPSYTHPWSATSVCGSTGPTPATHDRRAGADHSPPTTRHRTPPGLRLHPV